MLKEYRAARDIPTGEIDVLDYDQFRKDWRDHWQAKQTEFYELETAAKAKFKAEQLKVVQVDKPSKLKTVFAKGFSAEERSIIQSGVDEFTKLVSDEFLSGESFTYKKTRDRRSFYTDRVINLSARARTEKGRSTVIHETAHGLEMINQKILDSAVRFYEHRTKGESFVRLAQVTKIKSYGSEMCKVDKFSDPYDGKKPYTKFDKDANGRWYDTGIINATEIITRGMEYIWQDPAKFAADQPEYFDFIYRVLRGESWQPSSK